MNDRKNSNDNSPGYFNLRNIKSDYYSVRNAPRYLKFYIPTDKDDINGTKGFILPIQFIKIVFLALYKLKMFFWNRITGSSFHKTSVSIFTYEIKVIAK